MEAKLNRKNVLTERDREGRDSNRFQASMKVTKLEGEEAINKEWMSELVISDVESLRLMERLFHFHYIFNLFFKKACNT